MTARPPSPRPVPLVRVAASRLHPDSPDHHLELVCEQGHVLSRPRKWRRVRPPGRMLSTSIQRLEDDWPKKIRCPECREVQTDQDLARKIAEQVHLRARAACGSSSAYRACLRGVASDLQDRAASSLVEETSVDPQVALGIVP